MEIKKLIALILSILLIIGTILNIINDLNFSILALIIWSLILSCLNLFASVVIIISLFKDLSIKWYTTIISILSASDLIALLLLFIMLIAEYFDYVKLINIIIITPLIVVIHFIMKEMFPNSDKATPIANQPA